MMGERQGAVMRKGKGGSARVGKAVEFIKRCKAAFRSFAAPMRRRLLLLLTAVVFTCLSGVFLLLALSGVLSVENRQIAELLGKEFSHVKKNVETQMGKASAQGILLSQRLSQNIMNDLTEMGLSVSALRSEPELLDTIVARQTDAVMLALEKTDCSGVFLVLDATRNPQAEGGEHSRAGVYIRSSETKSSGVNNGQNYLYGPIEIARERGLGILSKWSLEFDTQGQAFFNEPMRMAASNPGTPLSRMVFWDYEDDLAGLSESVMLCSVPLLDEIGKPFGVCGFEVSDMNFRRMAAPDTSIHHDIVTVFAPRGEAGVNLTEALFAGSTTVARALANQAQLSNVGNLAALSVYETNSGTNYAGQSEEISLYGADSLFVTQRYAVTVAIPKSALDDMEQTQTGRIALVLAIALLVGIGLSALLSKRFVKPIVDTLNTFDTGGSRQKTNFTEIDLLIERLEARGSQLPDDLFDDFVVKVSSLTPAEMNVFKAHAEGKTAEEMAKTLFIAASTLKKHNSHIYEKLGVASQDELRLYISLLKQCGMIDRIFP
jgi:DNA-binding CsgD family transcriptional regulator